MRRTTTGVLLILSFSIAFAGVEANVFKHKLYPGEDLSFHVEVEEDFNGTADLKFCLAEFNFDDLNYNYRCDIFLNRFDITFNRTYSNDYTLSLQGVQPFPYRLFVQVHFNDKYHKDSDKDNIIYLMSEGQEVVYVREPGEVVINDESIPSQVEQGEEFTTFFNVTNYNNCTNYLVYSFVYGNNSCITGNFWTNREEISLPKESTIDLRLNNTIGLNSTPGVYDYTLRVEGCGKEYELKKPISVLKKQKPWYDVFIEDGSLVLKNYEPVSLSYELTLTSENGTRTLNDSVPRHTRRNIPLGALTQYVTLTVNDAEVFNELIVNDTLRVETIQNNTIIYKNKTQVTTEIVREEVEGKPFYIISFLTSVGALSVLYKGLR